ncbi:flagellar filament capping protein FliD [Planctomycetes bacterium K23_9]|uniref:Flagellar hook-associated protein 2 n=1 Tax=Stieleria marina TaxID=1930275 RepID=A0A517NXM7_9BACT|nr:Flagellar hook-associated protein 2 [Planctomycetes bacterium K23_9]
MFSIDGIVSGFDTTSIIESLLGFQQTQIDTFNSRKAEITTEQSSFKGVEASLLTLQGSIGRLNRTTNSVFDARTATSSDEDTISVAADGGANSGVYRLTVDSLATAHQIGSQGFATTSDQIATGDITFRTGDGAETTIAVDSGNNTLTGLVSSINDQVSDANASIVYDQSADSYRLLVTSTKTGVDNEIVVTNTMDGNTGTIPDFSGPAVQEASDAVITLGSGPGAITASYSSNTVDGLIENVTLDLKQVSDGDTVTIEIEEDIAGSKDAIESFVSDFNSIMDFIDAQTKYNPDTDQASPLLGNRSVSNIKNKLLTSVSDTIATTGGVSRLSQIGVDLNAQGKLQIDDVKLTDALNGNLEGVDPKEIRNLFGLNATSTNSGIEFQTGGNRTNDSLTPYEVDITQAAEQATITGSAIPASVTIDDTNNELQITLDGIVSETLTLAEGTYTADQFAAHVQSTINNSDELGVHKASVSLSTNNELIITSEVYGDVSKISSVSGSALSTLGFSGTESDQGQDVEGVFIVDGVEEAAIGSGRILIGKSDNEYTADLQLRVTLTADQVVVGADAEVQVSRGVTGRLDKYVEQVLDTDTGILKTVDDEYQSRLDTIDDSITRVEELTASKRDYLLAEFTALETIMSELQNTGNFISSQLSTLSTFNSKS